MPRVDLRHRNESFESLFRRFRKAVEKADIIRELRRRECYEKPSEVRKRAKAAAQKRHEKKVREMEAARNPRAHLRVSSGKRKKDKKQDRHQTESSER